MCVCGFFFLINLGFVSEWMCGFVVKLSLFRACLLGDA